ncbi:MAG TPA: ATP-grasp domain-containing protein, partial [Candidatus Methylacidiphilales bacterium]
GRVILRQVVRMRHSRKSPQGFPVGREYRVFVLHGSVVSLGYYWEGDDVLAPLSAGEEEIVRHLATEAAKRLAVPFVAVDIGQVASGDWIVIETGDGQFSGLSQVPVIEHWHKLKQAMEGMAEM